VGGGVVAADGSTGEAQGGGRRELRWVETDALGKVRATSARRGGRMTTGWLRIQFGRCHHGGVQQGGRLGVGSDAWQDLMSPPTAPCRCRRGGGGR
jgi:hypothetical protein